MAQTMEVGVDRLLSLIWAAFSLEDKQAIFQSPLMLWLHARDFCSISTSRQEPAVADHTPGVRKTFLELNGTCSNGIGP